MYDGLEDAYETAFEDVAGGPDFRCTWVLVPKEYDIPDGIPTRTEYAHVTNNLIATERIFTDGRGKAKIRYSQYGKDTSFLVHRQNQDRLVPVDRRVAAVRAVFPSLDSSEIQRLLAVLDKDKTAE